MYIYRVYMFFFPFACVKEAIYLCMLCLLVVSFLFAVDGGWTSWNSWSPCECELAEKQNRYRSCTNPRPFGELGRNCTGPSHEQRECTRVPTCSDGRYVHVYHICRYTNSELLHKSTLGIRIYGPRLVKLIYSRGRVY